MTDENPPEGAEPPEGTTAAEEGANAEAAKWRRKLREAEAELEVLRERVDRQARESIEGRVADRLQRPEDLWLVSDLGDLIDDDGNPDDDKVTAALEGLLSDRPHWAKPAPGPKVPVRPKVDHGAPLTGHSDEPGVTWSQALAQAADG